MIYNNKVKTDHYKLEGKESNGEDVIIDIWYDKFGRWVKMIFIKDGSEIEYISKKFDKNKKTKNPSELLGVRKDLTPKKMAEFAQKFKDAGATILGGCCETRPSHIKAFSQLK